jgi:hypothetical protein
VTGPFTATLDLGSPFKLQSEPYALANATTVTPTTTRGVTSGDRRIAQAILIVLCVVVAGALAFTYRKRPVR